jgi:hypothetical protein
MPGGLPGSDELCLHVSCLGQVVLAPRTLQLYVLCKVSSGDFFGLLRGLRAQVRRCHRRHRELGSTRRDASLPSAGPAHLEPVFADVARRKSRLF